MAVKLASELLGVRGAILPATTSPVQLRARMEDGSRVRGETRISTITGQIAEVCLAPQNAQPLTETLQAVAEADLITLGPGSLFTSLVPHVLVRGIPEAIAASHAVKVFICNLMTQANESLGLTASDHIRVLHKHAGRRIFDYALINQRQISPEMRAWYEAQGAAQVMYQTNNIEAQGVRPIVGDFLVERGAARHAIDRLAKALMDLLIRHQRSGPLKPMMDVGTRVNVSLHP